MFPYLFMFVRTLIRPKTALHFSVRLFSNFVKVETELRLAIPADGPGLFTSESCWNLPTGFHRGLSEAAAVAAAFSVATANG